MPREIVIPALDIPVVKEMLYDTVKDKYKNIKGMLAFHQQFYFSTVKAFNQIIKSSGDSLVKMIANHPENQKFSKQLSLAGETLLDIVVNPGTVDVKYPQYNSQYEYKVAGMYNMVAIENLPENPVVILRIKKSGKSLPEIFFVGKKIQWDMMKWSEILLYPDKELFDSRVRNLLMFFDIPKKEFDSAVSSFKEGPPSSN